MVINIANFNFDGGSVGGGKPALLQEKKATIVQNGSQTIVPDEGFDGMSSVQINAAITGASSAIDFSPIGYDAELSAELNAKFNDDVAYSKTLLDAWNPSNASAGYLYQDDIKLAFAPNIDTSNVINMTSMFEDCSRLTSVPAFDTSKVTLMRYMFKGCIGLTTVPELNTSNVTNMNNMFKGCTSLQTVPELDTSKVTDMGYMFDSCTSLTTVPTFDTSQVTLMRYMFASCTNLQTVPELDTSKVTDMSGMFSGCTSLTSVPTFDTSQVTTMESMFYGCSGLTTIEGISFKSFSASTMSQYYFVGYSKNNSIRKAVFKDIGYNSNAKQFNTSYITNWGVNSDEILDARQSLIDSLITYSFDRATAGYPTCTITLSSTTKALLTADEIAQVETKGYVIA